MEKLIVKRVVESPKPATESPAEPAAEPAERRRLIVHIGMHKTGTTSIQYAMHENMQKLMMKGTLYPSTGRHPVAHVQHALVHRALSAYGSNPGLFGLRVPINKKLILDALLHEIELSGAKRVVLSAEDLWTLDPNGVKEFAKVFEGFEIEPIIYVRSMADFIDAVHQTRVRYGIYHFGRLNDPNYKFWEDYASIDLVAVIRNWASIAHDGKCWVQNYDADGHRDSIESFCKIAGIEKGDLEIRQNKLNTSLPLALTLLKTELVKRNVDQKIADGLVEQLSRIDFKEPQTLIPSDERRNLEKSYAEAFDTLMKSDFVKCHPDFNQASRRAPERVFVAGLSGVLFAIGRALTAHPGKA